MKLNLGSGERHLREGYTNVDKHPSTNTDIVHDLEVFPYPFGDNSIDEVYMRCVLEHIDSNKTLKVIEEIYRICKDNAKVVIVVPFEERWMDCIDHKRGFSFHFFKTLCNEHSWKGNSSILFKFVCFRQVPMFAGKLIPSDRLRQVLSYFLKGLIYTIECEMRVMK